MALFLVRSGFCMPWGKGNLEGGEVVDLTPEQEALYGQMVEPAPPGRRATVAKLRDDKS